MFLVDFFLPYPWVQLTILVGLVILIYLFRKPKHSPFQRPFRVDARRPREPLEYDQKIRTLRLKQRFSEKALPSEIDAVVVGSGLGGLAAAAILAKTGRKVVVLEQHDQAGGCCHTFIEQGYEWDVGIHYVGQQGPEYFDRFMLDQLTEGQVEWQKMDENFDNIALVKSHDDVSIIPIWGDRQRFLNDLIKRYPKHEKGLRDFFDHMNASSSCFRLFAVLKLTPFWLANAIAKLGLYKLSSDARNLFAAFHGESLKAMLDRHFGQQDDEVKLALCYIFGDIAVEPSRTGCGLFAGLFEHYTGGAYYPIGGSSEIAYNIIPTIERAGGRVLVNANVTEILLANGKATGVRVATSSGPVEIKAPLVISGAGVSNTFRRLLPKNVASRTRIGKMLDSGRIRPGLGLFQVFIGLNGSQADLKLPNTNYWIYNDINIDKVMSEWGSLDLDQAVDTGKFPLLFVAFPSAKDPTYNIRFPGRSVCTIITISPIEWFRQWEDKPVKKRGKDYEALKMQLARKAWDQVLSLFPQLADNLDHIDCGTPLTANYYINAFAGESYGLDHDTERFSPDVVVALRPQVPEIGNLYLTGQDVLMGGMTSALFSSHITCQAIFQSLGEHSNLFGDLEELFCQNVPQTGDNKA